MYRESSLTLIIKYNVRYQKMKVVTVSSSSEEHRQLYNKNGYNLAIFPGGFVKYGNVICVQC